MNIIYSGRAKYQCNKTVEELSWKVSKLKRRHINIENKTNQSNDKWIAVKKHFVKYMQSKELQ